MSDQKNRTHTVHVVPFSIIEPPAPADPRQRLQPYPAVEAALRQGKQIAARIDWDGNPEKRGRFEIDGPEGWHEIRNLETHTGINDLIFPVGQLQGQFLTMNFERAEENRARAFEVRAIAVRWRDDMELPSKNDANFLARRWDDYQYLGDPLYVPWSRSQMVGGTQRATLRLRTGVDYEVWVNIQHPEQEDWQEYDPIVGTRSGETTGNATDDPASDES